MVRFAVKRLRRFGPARLAPAGLRPNHRSVQERIDA